MGPRVAIESPLRATDVYSREQFRRYWQLCVRDSIDRGEDPYLSHWLADILDDDNVMERTRGISCGLNWSSQCQYAVFYMDFGMSPGMKDALDFYNKIGKRTERRTLGHQMVKLIHEMDDIASDSAAYAEPELTDFS